MNIRLSKRELGLFGLFIVGSAIAVGVLAVNGGDSSATTPWQIIPAPFLYIFCFNTLLLAGIIFSRAPTGLILAAIVLHSLVFHSYLPLSHSLLYGADGWRHIGSEQRLLSGLPLAPAVISDQATQSFIQRLDLGALSYASLWWLTIGVAKFFGFSLLVVTIWLVPVLWSVSFPLLLYSFARALGLETKKALLVVWFSFLPFALTASGSLTLPSTLGFLPWLGGTVLLARYTEKRARGNLIPLLVVGAIILFGYTLYAVLFALQLVIFFLISALARADWRARSRHLALAVALSSALVLPLLELVAGFAGFNPGVNVLGQVKQLVGNLTAAYLAAGPRAHDIATGNIIFNQTPLSAFVANAFTWSRWWLVLFMLAFFACLALGLARLWRSRSILQQWLAACTVAVSLGYCLSRYLLIGEQVLTRRLDPVLALLWITLCSIGFFAWQESVSIARWRRVSGIAAAIFVSAATAASYSLGPDTGTLSADQYLGVQYVWGLIQKKDHAPCVVADTYPLLALEAASARQIIGGGLPISQYFAQPEQARLYADLVRNPGNQAAWQEALSLSGAEQCYVVAPFHSAKTKKFFVARFGDVGVWQYTK